MSKQETLIQLINHLFDFDREQSDRGPYQLQDFVAYLNTRTSAGPLPMRQIGGEEETWIREKNRNQKNDISILLVLLYRYAKGYVKKALRNSIIQTADEFSFLITLMTFECLTKTELINKQVMEKTSGTEVIKRLLNQGLIHEFADQQDKRSVRVAITDKGKKEIVGILPEMQVVSKVVAGNLDESEVATLLYLLRKLDYHHNDIFLHRKNAALQELLP